MARTATRTFKIVTLEADHRCSGCKGMLDSGKRVLRVFNGHFYEFYSLKCAREQYGKEINALFA